MSILDDMRVTLVRELEGLQQEVALFPDDSLLWVVPDGVTNSVGNLALHVAGNLRHFIGRVLGGIAFERDRAAEFGRRSGSREEVIEELRQAVQVVSRVLPVLSEAQLDGPFEAHPGVATTTRRFLLHLCTHAAFHVGQAGYLRRIVTGDRRSTNTVSASRLAAW